MKTKVCTYCGQEKEIITFPYWYISVALNIPTLYAYTIVVDYSHDINNGWLLIALSSIFLAIIFFEWWLLKITTNN